MRRFLAGVVALFLAATLATPVLAQSGASVRQSGASVTAGSVPYWVTNGVIGDSVTAADSPVTSFGVTSSGSAGFCVNSARVASGSWISLCEGYVSGVPTISVQNNGAASAQPLQFIVNGTTFPFPGSLANITIGTTPVVGGTNSNCLFVSGGFVGQQPCQLSAMTSLTGDVTATGPGVSAATLATVNSNVGTWGSGSQVPSLTVNAKGLITAASQTPLALTVGTTTIAAGSTNGLLYTNGSLLGNLGTIASGVLVTSAGGVPSIATTLPSGLSIGSPTFTGTLTLPDSATWSSVGISKVAALSVGSATLPSGGNVSVSGQYQVNGTQIAASNLSNGTTGSGSVVLAASPTLSGTVAGSFTLSGALTLSGNDTFTAQGIFQGTSAPASAAGNSVVMGTIAAPTLTNTGQAFLYNTAVNGAILQGDGSTNDVSLFNKGGSLVFGVPTGTTKLNFPSLASGTCSSGLGLDSGNNTILVSCPGAAASIQVGTTQVNNSTASNEILTTGTVSGGTGTLANISITGPLQNSAGALSINATTTAHAVAVWEGTSAMAAIGPGTLGQALISQGGSADPAYKSGAWVLLNTLVASNSTVLADTSSLTSSYNEYLLVFESLVPATNNVQCVLQVHSGGSFRATGYLASYLNGNGTTATSQSTTTFIPCSIAAAVANSAPGVNGTVEVFTPSAAITVPFIGHTNYFGGSAFITSFSGIWNTAAAVDGFEVSFNSGNITSGTIKVYGRL